MHWLFLPIAVASLVAAFYTASVAAAALFLVLAAGFALAWLLAVLSARVDNASRDETQILGPAELRHLGGATTPGQSVDPATGRPARGDAAAQPRPPAAPSGRD